MAYEVVIRNSTVVDGSGAPGWRTHRHAARKAAAGQPTLTAMPVPGAFRGRSDRADP